ncbi:MAG: MFS transporter [Corallococcus sp.]|nr:MFS transporter [Corallococcus sp.]
MEKKHKLNSKRTLLVGFAFFLICAFWQAYDGIVPLMLVNKFGLNQTWSGFIMALDNILALFMLPLFGALSDKTKSKYGKRTPYIVIGTVVAVVCFVGLTFADNAQLAKISEGSQSTYWEQNYTVSNNEYDSFTNKEVPQNYEIRDYAAKVYYNKTFEQLTKAEQTQLQTWYSDTLNEKTLYSYDKATDAYTLYDGDAPDGVKTTKAYSSLVTSARSRFASEVTSKQVWVLVIFIALLLLTLIAMATFRSPAVALMPDVTIKPLRSKANAIINLMGTAGGMLVLLLGNLFGTGKVENQIMSYTWFVCAVCGIMLIALLVFIFTVKEKQWNDEMLQQQEVLDREEAEEEVVVSEEQEEMQEVGEVVKPDASTQSGKLPKDKLKSLILILASVALWFIGYNAITSKYSLYAVNVLNKDYNTTLMIAQGAAIAAYIPVGIVAGKLGRKKTILIGVALLAAAFIGACFVSASTPTVIMWILFALAGIAWATINVNSFPMVVELAQGGDIGKYTGYYYTASMAAQIVTPLLSGLIMDLVGNMSPLFPYGAIFVALSFVTMLFVKHGDSKPESPKDKLEMLGGADD